MNIDQVLDTYDAAYAAEYDETYLLSEWSRESTAFQLRLLEGYLAEARNWLDVACGTGWVLSRFPNVERAGLDISAPMLERARQANPGVRFVQRDFREPFPEWNNRWDLVTCMWWAYCLAETMEDIRRHVARLADWTSPTGRVFLPLCDPQKLDRARIRIPFVDPTVPGRLMITGITWTWLRENGKRHEDVLSPQVDHVAAMFRQHFETVRVIEGPLDAIGEGWRVQAVLVAEGRKAVRDDGPMYARHEERPGHQEWLLGLSAGCTASLSLPSGDGSRARIRFEETATVEAWGVQLNRTGFPVDAGRRYTMRFRARADAPRPVSFGVALREEPFTGLGLYATADVGTDWTMIEQTFDSTGSTSRARVHFDLAASAVPVEIEDVELLPDADTNAGATSCS